MDICLIPIRYIEKTDYIQYGELSQLSKTNIHQFKQKMFSIAAWKERILYFVLILLLVIGIFSE